MTAVVPGRYRVEACADPACDVIAHAWTAVDIGPGDTFRLRPP